MSQDAIAAAITFPAFRFRNRMSSCRKASHSPRAMWAPRFSPSAIERASEIRTTSGDSGPNTVRRLVDRRANRTSSTLFTIKDKRRARFTTGFTLPYYGRRRDWLGQNGFEQPVLVSRVVAGTIRL